MARFGVAGALLGVVFWSPASRAALAPSIEWDAPASCPSASALHERLTALIGSEPESSEELRVRGVILESGEGLRLTLEVAAGTRRSSRVFVARDCAELLEAAALAIALAMPDRSSEAAPALPEEEPLPPAADSARVVVDGAPPSPSALGWFIGGDAVIDFGALPAPALGVSAGAGLRLGEWTLGAVGSFFPAQALRVGTSTDVEFGLMVAELRSCRWALHGIVSLQPCLGFELGQLSAWGLELDSARRVRTLWLAPTAALEARAALAAGLQLSLRAASLLPLGRKQYAINRTDAVHAPAGVDFRLFAGLVLDMP